jgi:hypothetical protein
MLRLMDHNIIWKLRSRVLLTIVVRFLPIDSCSTRGNELVASYRLDAVRGSHIQEFNSLQYQESYEQL